MYCNDACGFGKIGLRLADMGHYTRKGKIFSDTSLKKMIINPRYKGYYTANLSEVEDYKTHKRIKKPKSEWIVEKDESGSIPAIVDELVWNKANQIYNERNMRWNKNVLNKEYYLEKKSYTSKIFCSIHNTTFIRSASGKRKDSPTWQCNEYLRHGVKGCLSPILYEKHLNTIFIDILESFIKNKDKLLNDILNDYNELIKSVNHDNEINNFKEKVIELETYKDRLFDMMLKEKISEDDFMYKNNKISNELKSVKNKIVQLELSKESPLYYKKILDNISDIIKPELDIKNNISLYFNLFIDKVFVSKINNDRKHIKLDIIFNFKNSNMELEVDLNNKLSFDNSFLASKYLVFDNHESRICRIRKKIRKRKTI